MKLTVKRISGPDCTIEISCKFEYCNRGGLTNDNGCVATWRDRQVTERDDVTTMKRLVEEKLQAPAHAIRLVFRGRTLTDEKNVGDCGLKEGDKLYAVIKKDQLNTTPPETKRTPSPTSQNSADLWTQLNILLRKHFRERDAEKVLHEFQKEFNQTINALSLDDIERLATVNLQAER